MGRIIDPHYHTKQSDGDSNVLESIASAQRKGLAALVITDHLSANDNWIAATRSYKQNIQIMKLIRHTSSVKDYPVIIGVELMLPMLVADRTEVLVFGTGICAAIQDHLKEISDYDLEKFKAFKDKFECAMVQCHPRNGLNMRLLPILDGCEMTRAGDLVNNAEALQKDCEANKVTLLASSDGHIAYRDPGLVYEVMPYLGKAYTVFSMDISNESDLIRAIKENLVEKRSFQLGHRENRSTFFPYS